MPNKMNVIGVDVGGTKVHFGIYDTESFEQTLEKKIPTNPERGLEAVLEEIATIINELKDENTVAVGIGLPGYIDYRKGILHKTPNIPHHGPIDLNEFFKEKIDLPMSFDNDVNLFTLTEYQFNSKEKYKNMVGLALGTGLGGGIIINGELYRGYHGFAGEFGHASMTPETEWEDHVSGKGNKSELGKYLGIAISNIIHIFDPEAIALGGSVMNEFEKIKDDMWHEIKKSTIPKSQEKVHIYVSEIDDPSTLGAAILAYKDYKNA